SEALRENAHKFEDLLITNPPSPITYWEYDVAYSSNLNFRSNKKGDWPRYAYQDILYWIMIISNSNQQRNLIFGGTLLFQMKVLKFVIIKLSTSQVLDSVFMPYTSAV
ncbi:hypothetical protein ACJX0J_031713, partial [Zea mays]